VGSKEVDQRKKDSEVKNKKARLAKDKEKSRKRKVTLRGGEEPTRTHLVNKSGRMGILIT